MATLEQVEGDTVSKKILQQLAQTAYTCSSLSPLSSRPGNYVYRGILARPFVAKDGGEIRTIIIKHSAASVANAIPIETAVFEESLLHLMATIPTPITTTLIKTPRLYHFNRETSIQILEDFHDTDGFKSVLLSARITQSSLATVGRHLGSWLHSFHKWGSGPEQSALRVLMRQNDSMRDVKYRQTYGSILKVLDDYPELLIDHQRTLVSFQNAMAKDFQKPSTVIDEGWGLVHGDFWSGNILLPTTPWQTSPASGKSNKMFIIDWEFAQYGHRSYDLGQIVGDLYERKIYNNLDDAIIVMEGLIDGYGELDDEMAFRTASYVGVHLISWYNRRPRKGPRVAPLEVIIAGLTIGRDLIIKGWEKDRKFFEDSALAPLFVRK